MGEAIYWRYSDVLPGVFTVREWYEPIEDEDGVCAATAHAGYSAQVDKARAEGWYRDTVVGKNAEDQ